LEQNKEVVMRYLQDSFFWPNDGAKCCQKWVHNFRSTR